jgi:hypothetical protein
MNLSLYKPNTCFNKADILTTETANRSHEVMIQPNFLLN